MAVSHCSLRLHCPMPLWIPGFRRGPTRAFAANVLNHFPMKQLNCFMSLQGSITQLIHWMAQGHMESYWNDTLSFIAAPCRMPGSGRLRNRPHCRDTTRGTTRAGSIGQQPVQHFAQMKNCFSTALTMAQRHSQISHCRCEIRSLPGRYQLSNPGNANG